MAIFYAFLPLNKQDVLEMYENWEAINEKNNNAQTEANLKLGKKHFSSSRLHKKIGLHTSLFSLYSKLASDPTLNNYNGGDPYINQGCFIAISLPDDTTAIQKQTRFFPGTETINTTRFDLVKQDEVTVDQVVYCLPYTTQSGLLLDLDASVIKTLHVISTSQKPEQMVAAYKHYLDKVFSVLMGYFITAEATQLSKELQKKLGIGETTKDLPQNILEECTKLYRTAFKQRKELSDLTSLFSIQIHVKINFFIKELEKLAQTTQKFFLSSQMTQDAEIALKRFMHALKDIKTAITETVQKIYPAKTPHKFSAYAGSSLIEDNPEFEAKTAPINKS